MNACPQWREGEENGVREGEGDSWAEGSGRGRAAAGPACYLQPVFRSCGII